MTTLKPSELTLHERTFLRLTDSIEQLQEDRARVREILKKTGCRHVAKSIWGMCQICWEPMK